MGTNGVRAGLALAMIFLGAAAPAGAQSIDNKGRDFILAFMPNLIAPTIEVHLTSDVPTDVTVSYPYNAPTFTTTVAVTPGAVTIVGVPQAASLWNPGVVENRAVRLTAPDEFVAYQINRAGASSDAALGLPVDTMNTEFVVMQYAGTLFETSGVSFGEGEVAVVAAYDATTVTITPKNDLVGGFSAGVPFDVVLNRGEGFLLQTVSTLGSTAELAGTTIHADRPIGVTNGAKSANVPPTIYAADHVFEVAHPVQTWGKQALGANLPNRPNGSIYRILASEDGTTVNQDGAFLATLDRGDVLETGFLTGGHEWTADKPIFVAQFMPSLYNPGATLGDPAMANMIPAEQYLTSYTFSTVGGGQFVENYVTIVAESGDVGALTLDGVPVAAGAFTAIGASGYSYAIVALGSGSHTTESPSPHGITVEGYNTFDSYAYPGGALFQFINPVGDANPPICDYAFLAGPPPSGQGSATDARPSEDTDGDGALDPGEDLNGNGQIDTDTGVFFVQLLPGATNLTLDVAPFVPGDGSASFTVSLTDPGMSGGGTIRATDGAGNFCEIPVSLDVAVGPVCGDGVLDDGEDCDDGNVVPGDGCDANCQVEPICGNGEVDEGEDCDDGNVVPGDGCDANCQVEPICGNGEVDEGEECDDGNTASGDGCDANCQVEVGPICGNGVLDDGEDCDDGNVVPGDGCDANCQVEPICGNGEVDEGEECDDGNTASGDGCDANCQIEVGPICGDGVVDDNEECDDGNTVPGDGCDESCLVEIGQVECCVDRDGDGWAAIALAFPFECLGAGEGVGSKTTQFGPCGPDGAAVALDCEDGDPAINPGVSEIPGNGVDENCNGTSACGVLVDDDAGASSWAALVLALPFAGLVAARRRLRRGARV